MKVSGKNILIRFTKHWQLLLSFETFGYAIGASLLVYFLSFNVLLAFIVFIGIALIAAYFIKPWKPNLDRTSQYLDKKLNALEYSTDLFLKPYDKLSNLAKLQQFKIAGKLQEQIGSIRPPNNVFKSSLIGLILIIIGLLGYQFNWVDSFQSPKLDPIQNNAVVFKPLDSLQSNTTPPSINKQSVTIQYPSYTHLKTSYSSNMDIKAVEGSRVSWNLQFNTDVEQVTMESMGNVYPMDLSKDNYIRSSKLKSSGFYNFKFSDAFGQSYSSIFYAIEVVLDAAPIIEIPDIKQFTTFNYDEKKILNFKSHIVDDFGIDAAYIIATVSKGSGESVKFREEILTFDNSFKKGNKSITLSKLIDLDEMQLEPGDELYFYVEATDLKQPKQNRARSETYFATIKDTTSYVFGVEGTLGVDRMPDYFRSQRQLIIDTEKLISEKNKITVDTFKFKSNELGFDQKALRLKYAEFMGEETESGLVIEEDIEALEADDNTDENVDETDPLAEYTHDHDGDNEHNLVDSQNANQDSKNPLQEFMHDHEDPEAATLFEESMKAKLLKALNEMWDAELYLRLYTPEKSLPYQYRALKLIQDIKNSARIYVHRIGFDPPPIKEDKRLTGELKAISSFRKYDDSEYQESYPFMRKTLSRLEQLIEENREIGEDDKVLFENAGNELAQIAIENPGKYLFTLQQLKELTTYGEKSIDLLNEVQNGLHLILPLNNKNPLKSELFRDELNHLLLKELENHD